MPSFNLRVYALIINEKNEILLSLERRNGFAFVKFPGGGVESGEGIVEALIRELDEELGLKVKAEELQFFYFNDFFQASAFRQSDQIVAFYYVLKVQSNSLKIPTNTLVPTAGDYEIQQWKSLQDCSVDEVTFPIDKLVLNKLIDIQIDFPYY